MKMLGIDFFLHWSSSRACVLPLFFVLYMFTIVVLRNGCTNMAIVSVKPRSAFFSYVRVCSFRQKRIVPRFFQFPLVRHPSVLLMTFCPVSA